MLINHGQCAGTLMVLYLSMGVGWETLRIVYCGLLLLAVENALPLLVLFFCVCLVLLCVHI